MFVFSFEEGRAFIAAIKDGKYDLPAAQEQEVIAYLAQQKSEAGGDLSLFANYIPNIQEQEGSS